jgi:hypothetical protein
MKRVADAPPHKDNSMNSKKMALAGALMATMTIAAAAHAVIVATTGDVIQLVPAGIALGQAQSNTDIIAFQETQCGPLGVNLNTDQGVLPANTPVECHILHADPVNMAVTLQGRIRFATPIVGIISASADLDASDVPCARAGVNYPAAGAEPYRGLDTQTPLDGYVLLSATELAVRMDVPSYSDQIRVLTACD